MIVTKRFAEYTSLSVEIQLTISVVIDIDIIGRCNCNYSTDIFQPNIHVYFYPGDRSGVMWKTNMVVKHSRINASRTVVRNMKLLDWFILWFKESRL
jgi:hypothetical protein